MEKETLLVFALILALLLAGVSLWVYFVWHKEQEEKSCVMVDIILDVCPIHSGFFLITWRLMDLDTKEKISVRWNKRIEYLRAGRQKVVAAALGISETDCADRALLLQRQIYRLPVQHRKGNWQTIGEEAFSEMVQSAMLRPSVHRRGKRTAIIIEED